MGHWRHFVSTATPTLMSLCNQCEANSMEDDTMEPDLPIVHNLKLDYGSNKEAAAFIQEMFERLAESRDWMERAADRVEATDHHNGKSMASHLRRQADYNRELMHRLETTA